MKENMLSCNCCCLLNLCDSFFLMRTVCDDVCTFSSSLINSVFTRKRVINKKNLFSLLCSKYNKVFLFKETEENRTTGLFTLPNKKCKNFITSSVSFVYLSFELNVSNENLKKEITKLT